MDNLESTHSKKVFEYIAGANVRISASHLRYYTRHPQALDVLSNRFVSTSARMLRFTCPLTASIIRLITAVSYKDSS